MSVWKAFPALLVALLLSACSQDKTEIDEWSTAAEKPEPASIEVGQRSPARLPGGGKNGQLLAGSI